MRLLILSLMLALGLTMAPPAPAQQDDGAVHPEIQKANAQREKIERRERLLLLFPAGVLGLTIALVIITRRRR
ncbi:hypothetical protein ACLD02_03865 [Alloalcanivorax sp. C16-2]|uniref:hypothetical protein n=1 Tax=Alloalcanivorax TaxID=3020832 RepID=UPI001EE4E326|nr:hypothetical protein [Alloalcanivorax marinus]